MRKKTQIKWKFMKLNGVLNRVYKVSNMGSVVLTKTMKPLKQTSMGKKCKKNGTDYKSVPIAGYTNPVRVHRIVCETFHGQPGKGKTQVNHKNERKSCNTAHNLEWVTPSENAISYCKKNPSIKHSTSVISNVKKLANRGWSNDRIAQRVKMSDSNVSRIKFGYLHAEIKPYTTEQIDLGNI